jgi:hypothetical protein
MAEPYILLLHAKRGGSAMELNSFHAMLVPLAVVFSQPSFQNFALLMEGWILAGSRAMTSTALESCGPFPKHFATYYRFFQPCGLESGSAGRHLVTPRAPVCAEGACRGRRR